MEAPDMDFAGVDGPTELLADMVACSTERGYALSDETTLFEQYGYAVMMTASFTNLT